MRARVVLVCDVPGDHGIGVLHARDGTEDEHVDGLAWVPRSEDSDGLQRDGVMVCEVADELLREEARADGTPHQFGAVVVEAGPVPGSAVAARVDALGDDLQFVGVEALLFLFLFSVVGFLCVKSCADPATTVGFPKLRMLAPIISRKVGQLAKLN